MDAFVTIVLTTYNPILALLKEQINSISLQTFKNWKCYIIDDNSNEIKLEEIKELTQNDPRFEVLQNPNNLKSFHNFEEGLKKVDPKSDFVALCDQDDVWMSYKLENMLKAFISDEVIMVHSDLYLIDIAGTLTSHSCWEKEKRIIDNYDLNLLTLRNSVTGCSCIFRSNLLRYALPFPKQNNSIKFHHDQWLALFASTIGKIVAVKESLVKYRQHTSNVVGSKELTLNAQAERVLNSHHKLQLLTKPWTDRHILETHFIEQAHSKNLTLPSNFTPLFVDKIDFGIPIFIYALKNFKILKSNFYLLFKLIVAKKLSDLYFLIKRQRP